VFRAIGMSAQAGRDIEQGGRQDRGGRRSRSLAIAIAALGIGVSPASAVPAPANHVVGQPSESAQTAKKSVWGPIKHDGRSMFPIYHDLGAGIYQTQAHWDQIAYARRPAEPKDPNDPAYAWPSYLDYAVAEAEKQGMTVMIQIIGAPSWANGDRHWSWAPQQPSDFADFATAIATRYPSVKLWMIWGEPNRRPNFKPLTPGRRTAKTRLNEAQAQAPRTYAQILDAAYVALKDLDPANLVIGGNTYTAAGWDDINAYQWIRYLELPDGSRPRMDMYGHNPFTFHKPAFRKRPSPNGAVAFGDLHRLAQRLDRTFPDWHLPLFLSEWGVPIGFKDKDLLFTLKAREGKKWIKAAFRIARRWDRIYTLGWVHPVDTERNSQGLLDADGNPKPGYDVFKAG
jgi:Cellulase (glycosyl hydrolase family 5)